MSRTEPTRRPPICTSSSLTSWPAFWNSSVYSVPPSPLNSSSQTASATASASAPAAAALATVTDDAPSRDDSSGSALHLRYVPQNPAGGNPIVAPYEGAQLFHPQRALGRTAEKLAHELVVGAEEILGRAGL